MKKVLILTDMYPHQANQVMGIFVCIQAEELAKSYEVRVVSYYFPYKYKAATIRVQDIDVTRIFFPAMQRFFWSAVFSFSALVLPLIKQICRQWQPDIIHVHDCRHVPELWVLRSWLNTQKTPQYLTLHNISTHPEKLAKNRLRRLYKSTLGRSLTGWTHVFTVNDRLKNWVLPFAGEQNVTVIGNAIQPTVSLENWIIQRWRKELSPQSYKLIAVGNLLKDKGFDLLIEAVHSLTGKGSDLQLVIVGDGPEMQHIRSSIRNAGLDKRIFLTGAVENAVVRNLYPLFDAFVLPSYNETFGIVYLEAMYAGLPVIGVQGQGIDSVVTHGVNGLLAKPRDAHDVEQKIIWLMQNPEQATSIASAGCELVKTQFMLPELIKRITDVYEK